MGTGLCGEQHTAIQGILGGGGGVALAGGCFPLFQVAYGFQGGGGLWRADAILH